MKQRLAALLLTLLLALSALPISTLAAPTPEPIMTPKPTATAEPAPEGEPAAPTSEPAFVGDPTEEPAPDIMAFIDGTTVAGGACGDHIRWKLSDRGLLTVYGAGRCRILPGKRTCHGQS